MKHTTKKYGPEQRIVVRSRAEIPAHFASEDEEREWWATHELADDLLPDEETIDRLTDSAYFARLRSPSPVNCPASSPTL